MPQKNTVRPAPQRLERGATQHPLVYARLGHHQRQQRTPCKRHTHQDACRKIVWGRAHKTLRPYKRSGSQSEQRHHQPGAEPPVACPTSQKPMLPKPQSAVGGELRQHHPHHKPGQKCRKLSLHINTLREGLLRDPRPAQTQRAERRQHRHPPAHFHGRTTQPPQHEPHKWQQNIERHLHRQTPHVGEAIGERHRHIDLGEGKVRHNSFPR